MQEVQSSVDSFPYAHMNAVEKEGGKAMSVQSEARRPRNAKDRCVTWAETNVNMLQTGR